MARLFLKNNQAPKAIECLEHLLRLNSSNEGYYRQIINANGVDTADPTNIPRAIEILEKYEEVLPRSNTQLRLAIDLLEAGD